jgi:hypothetical protein
VDVSVPVTPGVSVIEVDSVLDEPVGLCTGEPVESVAVPVDVTVSVPLSVVVSVIIGSVTVISVPVAVSVSVTMVDVSVSVTPVVVVVTSASDVTTVPVGGRVVEVIGDGGREGGDVMVVTAVEKQGNM